VACEGNVVIVFGGDLRQSDVDGREAVSFLKRIKELIESPARMLMEI
jgi:hypothetical protein